MAQLLIGGQWVDGISSQALAHRYSGAPLESMAIASAAQVAQAVGAAVEAFRACTLTPSDRYRILSKAADLVEQRRPGLMATLAAETGFPRADCETEVTRTTMTLRLSAEEARRVVGEMVPLEATPGLKDRMGYTILVPLGVVCAITPFNSPLNVVAHKVAPALAGGNAVVLKPSEHVPLSAVALCQILLDAGLPAGMVQLLHGPGADIGRALVADPRIDFYTFTGSTRVGKEIQAGAGLRRTQLELGSIASTVVCADADLEMATKKIAAAAFRKAGQVCTSVQRVYVHRSIADTFATGLAQEAKKIAYGDPALAQTVVGPMITLEHAQRAQLWVEEAVAAGAQVLAGGRREGAVFLPTVLRAVKPEMRVSCEEIFAPVVSVVEFDELDSAYEQVNDTPFGLAVGVFTRDVSTAMRAGRKLRFGGIHINETSSSRVDVMPFGGVKDSGFGREGPRYAIREMMEERLVTIAY